MRMCDTYTARVSLARMYTARVSLARMYTARVSLARMYTARVSLENMYTARVSLEHMYTARVSLARMYTARVSPTLDSEASKWVTLLKSFDQAVYIDTSLCRGVPGRPVKKPEAPWERKGAKDAGPWLDVDVYKGRRGPNTHKVIQHL
jgi:hypothetical protein